MDSCFIKGQMLWLENVAPLSTLVMMNHLQFFVLAVRILPLLFTEGIVDTYWGGRRKCYRRISLKSPQELEKDQSLSSSVADRIHQNRIHRGTLLVGTTLVGTPPAGTLVVAALLAGTIVVGVLLVITL